MMHNSIVDNSHKSDNPNQQGSISPPLNNCKQMIKNEKFQESSANNNNNNIINKFEVIRSSATSLIMSRFHDFNKDVIESYTKDKPNDIETNAKLSIEKLKQLADHGIERLSPIDGESNQSGKFIMDHSINKYHNNILAVNSDKDSYVTVSSALKYSNPPSDINIDRIKFKRSSMANGNELTDFGFRIHQLGGFTSNYPHSESSEELNVDGNDDSCSQETSTVSNENSELQAKSDHL